MDPNVVAKFGPIPTVCTKVVVNGAPPYIVLLGQFVVNVALLILIQPPFVSSSTDKGDALPFISFQRVVCMAFLATSATWVMNATGTRPIDVCRGAVDVLRRTY